MSSTNTYTSIYQFQNNPQQFNSNSSTYEQRKSFGIMNILSKFKSNSTIICFPSWFAQRTKQFEAYLNNQVRYCGNSSDLWGLLGFQLKAIGPVLIENKLDVTLTKKNAQLGQIFMLYKAQSKLQNLEVRLQLKLTYIQKLTKFRQEIINIKQLHAKRSNLSLIEDEQVNKQYHFKLKELLAQNFSSANQQKNKKKLKLFLKNLIKTLKNKKIELLNQKTQLIIRLICMLLLFVLRNLNWKSLCLSSLNISHYIIRFLAQPNGGTKISKYLHDATPILLIEQLQKIQKLMLKQ